MEKGLQNKDIIDLEKRLISQFKEEMKLWSKETKKAFQLCKDKLILREVIFWVSKEINFENKKQS